MRRRVYCHCNFHLLLLSLLLLLLSLLLLLFFATIITVIIILIIVGLQIYTHGEEKEERQKEIKVIEANRNRK